MGVDAFLKRYQVAVFGGCVAIAAYFQASGVGQLVAGHLIPKDPVPPPPASKALTQPSDKSGEAVLARNPFDSVTGPLDKKPVANAPTETAAPHVSDSGDPYKDGACSGVHASLITATDDPKWSFASISGSDGDKLRRIGDKVAGSFTVVHIGYYDSPEHDLTPRVWLRETTGSRCIVDMGQGDPAAPKGPDAAKTSPSKSKRAKLEADVKSKIKKVGENSFEVERSGVETIIQHYAKLAGSTRARGTKEGMRMSGIKPDSILGELGMKNGDLLQDINGFDMSDPDKAVDAYAKLRRAGKLDMTLMRDNAPYTVHIQIVK